MKLNLEEKSAKITIQNLDDLFYLYLLIDENDEIFGFTQRQEKILNKEGKVEKVDKKRIFLGIKVKKVYFHQFSDSLKVIGNIIEKPEDFNIAGMHHSFNLKVGDTIILKKEDWDSKIVKSILKSVKETYPNSLIVAVDYGEIAIGNLSKQGLRIVFSKSENIGSKRDNIDREKLIKKFIEESVNEIKKQIINLKPSLTILFGPSIVKDLIFEKIKDFKNIFRVSGSVGGIDGIYEALNNEEVLRILSNYEEFEDYILFKQIRDNFEKVAVGLEEVKKASEKGMVDKLLISTKILKENRIEIKEIAENVKKFNGDIRIINENSNLGEMLEKFGNIACILRWKA